MIFRVFLIFAVFAAGFYSLLHALTCTNFFRDPARVRRIVIRTLLSLGALLLAAVAFALIAAGESFF